MLFTLPVDDTGMCGIEDERATMPFRVDAAPLDDMGNAGQWVTISANAVGHGDGTALAVRVHPDRVAIVRAGTEVGQIPLSPVDRYSFAIVPQKLYVPTEEETAGKIGDNNKLSLYEDDGRYKGDPNTGGSPAIVENVLNYSEGAYVEGVIRFDLAPVQQQVVARRRARAP